MVQFCSRLPRKFDVPQDTVLKFNESDGFPSILLSQRHRRVSNTEWTLELTTSSQHMDGTASLSYSQLSIWFDIYKATHTQYVACPSRDDKKKNWLLCSGRSSVIGKSNNNNNKICSDIDRNKYAHVCAWAHRCWTMWPRPLTYNHVNIIFAYYLYILHTANLYQLQFWRGEHMRHVALDFRINRLPGYISYSVGFSVCFVCRFGCCCCFC